MDGIDEKEQSEAFSRFRKAFNQTLDWTPEQKLRSDRYLAERGRIEDGDWQAVVDAMNKFMAGRSD
jgi:hypothetical protein